MHTETSFWIPQRRGPFSSEQRASVKAPCAQKHCGFSLNATYRFLHCELNYHPASQLGSLKPTEVKGHDQNYQATSHISFGKHLRSQGAWRRDWASIQACVSETLKCHYLNTELSACICYCTTKYIIDVLMFSPLGLHVVCIANFTHFVITCI